MVGVAAASGDGRRLLLTRQKSEARHPRQLRVTTNAVSGQLWSQPLQLQEQRRSAACEARCVCVGDGNEGGRAADLIRCSACRTMNGSAAPSPAAAGGTAAGWTASAVSRLIVTAKQRAPPSAPATAGWLAKRRLPATGRPRYAFPEPARRSERSGALRANRTGWRAQSGHARCTAVGDSRGAV